MPKVPDVLSGETIESAWANNDIRNLTVQRATDEADRLASWPAPGNGETVWQQDTGDLYVWDGGAWIRFVRSDVAVVDKLVTGRVEAPTGGSVYLYRPDGTIGVGLATSGDVLIRNLANETVFYWDESEGVMRVGSGIGLRANGGPNTFTNLDGSILTSDYYENPPSAFGYSKAPGGVVTLSGRIANVDPGTIGGVDVCTLPVGVRPNTTSSFPIHNNAAGEAIRMVISTSGAVTFPAGGPGNSFYLDGTSFYAGW